MPPPELTPQIPGESPTNPDQQQASALPTNELEDDQPPAFMVKHNGGPRFIVIDAQGAKVGDFTGTREQAEVELQRLLDGGEPLELEPEPRQAPSTRPATKDAQKEPKANKQAVLTKDGWLCPEPVIKE
jgi:hypothetical protein